VYKLVEVKRNGAHAGVIKLSQDKHTWPGPKQVWRRIDGATMRGDLIAGADETAPPGCGPLLRQVMSRGRRTVRETLTDIRARCRAELGRLPQALKALAETRDYPVQVSETLERRRTALIEEPLRHR
jgi:nicotinate phosphoribosyltransferase